MVPLPQYEQPMVPVTCADGFNEPILQTMNGRGRTNAANEVSGKRVQGSRGKRVHWPQAGMGHALVILVVGDGYAAAIIRQPSVGEYLKRLFSLNLALQQQCQTRR